MTRYTYVISDIHGQFDALMEMMDKIHFGYDDELYILGDVIDRGPKSVECIKWIMEQDNVLTILGNHELLFFDNAIHDAPDIYNTLTHVRDTMTETQMQEVLLWIEDMPEMKIVTVEGRRFFLNHTQVPSEEYFKEDLTDRLFPEYSKYKDYYNLNIKDIIAVHGHIPTMQMRTWNNQEKSNAIWKNKTGTIIDIDCGAGYPKEGGCLGCLRLNDMKEFYVNV